jgi:hypothetical protein
VTKDIKVTNFRIKKCLALALFTACAATFAHTAAAETRSLSIQSILSTMNVAGGNETLQWQVAPTYSELFGLGVRGTIGGYVHEDFALGVIIDYAEHREEYLANAGVQLNDDLRIIGTIGLLKESEEFTLGAGREDVRQLQYGLSLKGSYNAGIVRGFEINAYHTNASSDTGDVETGELTGLQLVTQLQPSASSDLRIGAGYERAEWDGGEVNEGFTLQAVGSQKLSDVLALQYSAKSGQTENSFGFGLSYDLSTPDVRSSAFAVSLERIDGRNGISDDTRVAVTWTVGLGASGARSGDVNMSSMGSMSTLAREDLLAEVMTRPAFLPKRVMARAATGAICTPIVSNGGAFDTRVGSKKSDYLGIDASTLPENVLALLSLDQIRDPAPISPGIVDVYVNGVRYSGPVVVSAGGVSSLFLELADGEAFAEGDTIRVSFNAAGGCSELTFVAVADETETGPISCSDKNIFVVAGLNGFVNNEFLIDNSSAILAITNSVGTDSVSVADVPFVLNIFGAWIGSGSGFELGTEYTLNYNGETCAITAVGSP